MKLYELFEKMAKGEAKEGKIIKYLYENGVVRDYIFKNGKLINTEDDCDMNLTATRLNDEVEITDLSPSIKGIHEHGFFIVEHVKDDYAAGYLKIIMKRLTLLESKLNEVIRKINKEGV